MEEIMSSLMESPLNRILTGQSVVNAHPRLHFTAAELPRLRQKVATTHAKYLRLLLDWADTHATWQPRTDFPFEGGRTGEVELEESGTFVTNAALAYLLSQEPFYLQLAKQWALKMCEMPTDAANYGFGPYIAGLARAYDWLYAEFSDEERQLLRNHIAKTVRQLYLGSFPGESERQWWAGCQLHHDHWIATGGYGEAALAILHEVDDAHLWAARAMEEFETAFSWLGGDGAWMEGAADWAYTMVPLLWFFGAWQSVTSTDPHNVPWLQNTFKFRLYHWLPDNSYIYTNDSFRSGRYNTSGSASCHVLRRLAAVFGDGTAQWLADQDEQFDLTNGPKAVPQAAYEGSSYERNWPAYPHSQAFCAAWNVLWYDATVASQPPHALPLAHHFDNLGVTVLRSGWDADATVLSFACGPLAGHQAAQRVQQGEERAPNNYYHAHVDYNAFTLFAQGHYFVIPAGYARRDSRFQNTISINGAHLRADPRCAPRILAFGTTDDAHYVVGDATTAFVDSLKVQRYHRHVWMLPPHWVVIFDDVRLQDVTWRAWNRLEWTAHTDPTSTQLTISDQCVTMQQVDHARDDDVAKLKMYLLTPARHLWEQAELTARSGEGVLEALRVSVPEWNRPDMQVVTVWGCSEQATTSDVVPISLPSTQCHALLLESPGASSHMPSVLALRVEQGQVAAKPLLTYQCADAHHLFLCNLPVQQQGIALRRDGEQVQVWPGDEFQVMAGGWLQAQVGSSS